MKAALEAEVIADGETAARLFKRLKCAARALGLDIVISERRAGGEVPRVVLNGALLFEGLPRTEEIEQMLIHRLKA